MIFSMSKTKLKEELLQKIDKEQLMEFTEKISADIRTSGSEDEYRAFQYAENELKKFGFETNLYKKYAYISFPVNSSLIVNNKEFTTITHAMAQSTSEEGLTSEKLIYVGEGTKEELQKKDIMGSVILIDGLA